MTRVTGGQLLVRALQAEGVDVVFGLPGAAIFSAFNACLTEDMRVISCRHEAAAVHMADGFARARREPGVAIVTEGGGYANTMPGLAMAYAEGVPVLVLSGLPSIHELGKGAMQEIPQVEMARALTKWSALVPSIERLPEFLATAFRHLRTGRLGPVHLGLPVDVIESTVDEEAVPVMPSHRFGPTSLPGASPEALADSLDLLAQAKRPVIIAGTPAYWSRAEGSLTQLIEITKIPLFTREQARGMVSDNHPYCFTNTTPARTIEALAEADVVLLLGVKLDSRVGFGSAFAPSADLIQVQPDPLEVGKNRGVAVGIAADVGVVTEQLLAAAGSRSWPGCDVWLDSLATNLQDERPDLEDRQTPVHPLAVSKALEPFLDDTTFQAMEFGNFALWLMPYLRAQRPGGLLVSDTLNMLGAALPWALGVKVARPEARVVVLSGDGAFGFYPMELDTAVRHNLPFVAVVGNDAAWGIEQHFQQAMFGEGRFVGTSLAPLRYDRLAKDLGGHGENVDRPADLLPALERAFAANKPACVNVAIQTGASPATMGAARRFQQRVHDYAEGGAGH